MSTSTPTATTTTDVVYQILGVEENSPIAALRNDRPEQIGELQAYYDALFVPEVASIEQFSVANRALVAIRVAAHTDSTSIIAWYDNVARENGATDEQIGQAKDIATPNTDETVLGASIRRTDLITAHLVDAEQSDVQALKDAGLTPAAILSLSQVIAFVAYQIRFIAGLRAFVTEGEVSPIAPATSTLRPALGSDKTPEYTLDIPSWSPWLETANETDLTAEQRERVESVVGKSPNFAYQAVLANDFPALQARAKVHHHIFTSAEPEPTAWRELASSTASRINGCVFCLAVHARIYAQKGDKREIAETFIRDGIDADLPPTERAIVDLATKVTLTPESLNQADFAALRDLGFSDLGILDLINYSGFFGNANRLMLTLGEPVSAQK